MAMGKSFLTDATRPSAQGLDANWCGESKACRNRSWERNAIARAAAQSFTTWIVLAPYSEPDVAQLNNLYMAAVVAYMIVAWRLWPKSESDYRV